MVCGDSESGRRPTMVEKNIRELYAEAAHASPDYYEMYFQVMDALVPYWSDPGLGAIAFAHDAAARPPANSALYMRIVWHSMLSGYTPYALPINLPEMHGSSEDLVRKYPSQWNLNNMAHVACRSFDKPLTKSLIDKIGDGTDFGRTLAVDVSAWENDPGLFNKCKQWSSQ